MSGLLFVLAECGPAVNESEFNDWYDNEHAPGRLSTPGFLNALRYKATDNLTPTYVAFYDLASPSVPSSPPYLALSANPTELDKSIAPRLATLNRRVYEEIREPFVLASAAGEGALPGKFILTVSWIVQPELEADFHQWYDEEHIPELSKITGFIRARRYKLVSAAELGANRGSIPPTPDYRDKEKVHNKDFNFMTLYDLNRDDFTVLPEFIQAISTPWSVRVMGAAEALEVRRFGLHKVIERK